MVKITESQVVDMNEHEVSYSVTSYVAVGNEYYLTTDTSWIGIAHGKIKVTKIYPSNDPVVSLLRQSLQEFLTMDENSYDINRFNNEPYIEFEYTDDWCIGDREIMPIGDFIRYI